MPEKAFDVLQSRGYVEWCNAEDRLREVMDEGMITAYVGFDPTADSLHVGHLIPLMALAWLQRAGHRPIALAGGGTGLIGDPSGKSRERNLITVEEVRRNVEGVRPQLAHFLDFDCGANSALLLNNYDWLSSHSFLEVLRDVGKYFSVNSLIAREYVRSRLEDPEKGISYTEFSYVLLQAMDFRHLYETHGCRLQMGGNDQQGNLLAGSDYVRKSMGGEVFGLTQPLLLTASGTKFGKTEAGAVWLDPRRTSPYRFYQFWFNTDDRDVERLLKLFTFLPLDEIRDLMERHAARPEERAAQRRLALEVTQLVHGEGAALSVVKASSVLFDAESDLTDLTEETYAALREEVPFAEVDLDLPAALLDVLTVCGAFESRGEAKRAIRQGGVSLNGMRASDEGATVSREELGRGRYLFVRIGRKRFHLVAFS
ncbi:tyrosine--tRNA ligase [uncultured Fretibacterium sp.]|uniref:tyrosine--tRNA ligase n=1 Tax=uncultured Fretibacterium sp. TaxID=1678694 RepID=UPI002615A72E|nr:tyrosine--tRNA ligase [uncultured Fretibacterium sp.]